MHHSGSGNGRGVPAEGSFQSFAVGRRFHPAAEVEAGQVARLQHQPGNAKDPNALMVVTCEEPGRILGYLPATLAAILVRLVKDGSADMAVTVLERPKTPKASLPITIQVTHPCLAKDLHRGSSHWYLSTTITRPSASLTQSSQKHNAVVYLASVCRWACSERTFQRLLRNIESQIGFQLTTAQDGRWQCGGGGGA